MYTFPEPVGLLSISTINGLRKDYISKYLEYSDFVKPVIKLRMKSILYWNVL
jgi:hypothetical protein